MKRNVCGFVSVVTVLFTLVCGCVAQETPTQVLKQRERYTLAIALKFSKKNRNPLERTLSVFFDGTTPNAHATGFLVGNGLVMTAYHVVSGELSASKRKLLGFKVQDELEVTAFINSCEARVIKVDPHADLALLRMCETSKRGEQPTFQTDPAIDEKLLLIARPGDDKVVCRGSFYGQYNFRGQDYLSVKIDGRDGFSGSPVYNYKGEVIGVFCLYDWTKGLALISPGVRVKKLLDDYYAEAQIPATK